MKLKGWRMDKLDSSFLCVAIQHIEAQPAIKMVAVAMVEDTPLDVEWEYNTRAWYRTQARKLIHEILAQNPEFYGLEKIEPAEITSEMSAKELAEFCQVPVSHVYKLARGSPGNGLSKPKWPLGRTLKGRGWRFIPIVAQEYARRLVEE